VRFRILIKGTPFFSFLREMPFFLRTYHEIRKQARQRQGAFPFGKIYPCLEDRYQTSGEASGHYYHQDLLVATKIFHRRPLKHVDIGSSMNFVAHVASFREIEVFDIRDQTSSFENIQFRRADLMDRHFDLTDYCDSVSCLHVLEHFGLGRYGDRVDYDGHLLGWDNIHAMLQRGGTLYFSVPIGDQRIEFNAHRVFSLAYMLGLIEGRYTIVSFSYVNDAGDLVRDAELSKESVGNNFNCRYGCGIFELRKT
jgi:hypothetical protein